MSLPKVLAPGIGVFSEGSSLEGGKVGSRPRRMPSDSSSRCRTAELMGEKETWPYCFLLQAGKILLYYKDQTKAILMRFAAWCCVLVSNQSSSPGCVLKTDIYEEEIKCLAAAGSA